MSKLSIAQTIVTCIVSTQQILITSNCELASYTHCPYKRHDECFFDSSDIKYCRWRPDAAYYEKKE